MFSIVLALLLNPAAQAQDLKLCVQTCQAYSTPGYELRACVARCSENAKSSLPASMTPKQREAFALRCQYEPSLCQ